VITNGNNDTSKSTSWKERKLFWATLNYFQTTRVALYFNVSLFSQTFYLQAHSFYETLQKSKFSFEDIKENAEVRAWNEKGVVMITRGSAEQEVHSLANNDQNKSVNNIAQIQQ